MPKNLLTDLDSWRSYNPPRTLPPGLVGEGQASIVACPQCNQPTRKHNPRGASGVSFFLRCTFCRLYLSVPKPPRTRRQTDPPGELFILGTNSTTP